MKLTKKIIQFIIKDKRVIGIFFLMSLLPFAVACSVIITKYHPAFRYEIHEVRLYSPTVDFKTTDAMFERGHRINIVYKNQEFSYGSYKSAKTEELTTHERLQLEEYLDITYITVGDVNEIVEIHGVEHTYYTIDDYNANQQEILVFSIVFYIVVQILLISLHIMLVIWEIKGRPMPVSKRLRKKYPVEKHLYDDEENEFSPYKQKLIEQEREED